MRRVMTVETPGDLISPSCRAHGSIRIVPLIMSPMTTLAQPRLELVQARAFSFDGDDEAFRIASEAQRIRLAHLFDPYLAVHSSRIQPLPRLR